jgi:hypothetical protein
MMKTHFAPAERATPEEMANEIELVNQSSVLNGVLTTVGSVLAVLNDKRQVLAVNDAFLAMLGVENAGEQLGLRPGEVLNCRYAHLEDGGCGTSRMCASCGAAISIVTALATHRPTERICALTARRGGIDVDQTLCVRSHPVSIGGKQFLLLFLQDVTWQHQRAALERSFFHDVNNMLGILQGASELLMMEHPSDLSEAVHRTVRRLNREVAIQRSLRHGVREHYQPVWRNKTVASVLKEIATLYASHPAAQGKMVEIGGQEPDIRCRFETDSSLLMRILGNMATNALEETEKGGSIRIWAEKSGETICFCVWNAHPIPQEVAGRVFQRNFSTKGQEGRGIGTYSMKLFGEQVLGGSISFTSTVEDGTIFRAAFPLQSKAMTVSVRDRE